MDTNVENNCLSYFFILKKILVFTSLKSTVDAGDLFEVSVSLPDNNFKPQLHLAVNLFQKTISPINNYRRLTEVFIFRQQEL
jgi:hypothetical protein